MKHSAVIFDLDDTLAATSGLWRKAEVALLDGIGRKWTPELARKFNGLNSYDLAAVIHREFSPAVPLKEFQEEFRSRLLREYEGAEIRMMTGALECVRRIAARVPVAVASGSPMQLIEMALERTGMRESVSVVVSSESVPKGKPNPDVFLAAAAALGVEPAGCLVFEDSVAGLRAARAAGMDCIVIPVEHLPEMDELAFMIPGSLHEVTDELLAELLG